MSRVLIIGAGGVGGVVTHKCAQGPGSLFRDYSREPHASKNAKGSKANSHGHPNRSSRCRQHPGIGLPDQQGRPDVIINVALPYQDAHHYGCLP